MFFFVITAADQFGRPMNGARVGEREGDLAGEQEITLHFASQKHIFD